MLNEYYLDNKISELDLNCAETVLHVANCVYEMKLTPETMKLSSAFGGGMGMEDKCGALTASIMVLGYLFVDKKAHESELIKEITREYFRTFESEMGSLDCAPLKESHRTVPDGCRPVITAALQVLDSVIKKYSAKRVR
jgi:C_GCAxxG_C_C family probable redox protein